MSKSEYILNDLYVREMRVLLEYLLFSNNIRHFYVIMRAT